MSIYTEVIAISKVYLGPAAEKFIERQCLYLKVVPADLSKDNLKMLAWLSKNAAATIMDPVQAEKMAQTIEKL